MAIFNRLRFAGCAVLVLVAGCGKPAQIGSDEEAHKTVDALFTAITARQLDLVEKCDTRLAGLKASGKLPAEAHNALGKIVDRAKAGRWESAAERLYDFISGQEQQPAHEPKPVKKKG